MDFSAEQAVGVGLCALWLHNNLAHLSHLVYAPPFVTIVLCVINCTMHMFPTFALGCLNKVKTVVFFQTHPRRLRRRGERDYLTECLHPERRLEQLSYNLHDVLHQREWYRVVSFHFVHLDDNHLLFNMVALIALGPSLERSYGSLHFASVVMWLVVLQPVLMIVLALCVFATQSLHGVDILQHRLVGFSGVLFSLLVIEQYSSPSSQVWVGLAGSFGAHVDKRVAVFLQLMVVQFTLQRVSFVGHLCGVVAGIVYITVVSPLQHAILNTVLEQQETVLEQQETVFVFGQSLAVRALSPFTISANINSRIAYITYYLRHDQFIIIITSSTSAGTSIFFNSNIINANININIIIIVITNNNNYYYNNNNIMMMMMMIINIIIIIILSSSSPSSSRVGVYVYGCM